MIEKPTEANAPQRQRGMQIPAMRRIDVSTGPICLLLGLRDFSYAPKYGFVLGTVYALGGWLVFALLFWLSMPYLAYPAALGFAFIAPFIAAGFYEVSRRLETGQPLNWEVVLATVWQQKGRDMGWMALVTGFAFFIWVDYAAIIFLLFFGLKELEPAAFIQALTGTWNGFYFILLGNIAGAVMAMIVFSLTVISFPLLMDREIDFATAMTTSVKAVIANPLAMMVWAVIIGLCLFTSLISLFITLPVVLPVLGHGTWHMYRKVVTHAEQPEAERL